MTVRPPGVAIAIALALAAGVAGGAEDAAARAFVERLVTAINQKDEAAREALMHPGALACARELKKSMAEAAYAPRQPVIAPGFRWRLSALPAGSRGWYPDKFDYPVPPTHQLEVEFSTGPNSSHTTVLQVARHGREWREVAGCPRPETIAAAREAARARGEQAARIRGLAAALEPKLKEEIRARLAAGRKIDAIRHYQKASGEDLAIAKGVVEQLAGTSPTQ